MKNISFIFLLIATLSYSQINSQTKIVNYFYSGGYDSLLFDGADENSANFHDIAKDCLMKVLLVNGNVVGKVVKKEIVSICGKIDTLITYEKRQLKEGDLVIAGEPISTERDKDFVIAQLAEGENMVLGGERGLVGVKDYCRFPPNVYMTLDAGKLGIDWNPVLPKTVTVCSGEACLRIKGTLFSLEIVKEGDVISNILKVFEGSVSFGPNMESKAYSKKTEDQAGQMKKLTEDYQSGKISIEEFTKKMQELQKEMSESTVTEITVNAGFQSSITGTDKPTDPVPMDANEKPWWK